MAQYRLDEGTGTLMALAVPTVALPKPSGPRRMAVHPTLPVAYVRLDWAGKLVTYGFGADGQLRSPTVVSVFPAGKEPQAATGTMTAAEVEVSADGKTVYASTRTPDCQRIAVLEVDASGQLTLVANELAGGLIQGPRHFMLSRDNRHMIVANQDKDTLLVLAVNAADGRLSLLGTAVPTRVKMPNAVAFGSLSLT